MLLMSGRGLALAVMALAKLRRASRRRAEGRAFRERLETVC